MAKKKKTKHVLRPWCWYCERDFEDEKVLMQHQKAKHFKCGHCPRKLNTAGGLAVHIQQVHKLDPEPIENAIQGRNGYDIEIFGMEGIPAADVAAYKRKKEQELSLPPGYFGNKAGEQSKPAPKRNYENRVYTFEELRGMLETHRQLMGREDDNKMDTTADSSGPVLHAAPQNYILPPPMPGMPPQMPGGGMPALSMTGPPGAPPMPIGLPFPPGMPPFPPGAFPPHGMMPPMPPPGFPGLPPPEALGAIGKPPQMPGVPEAMGHGLPPPPPNPGMMPPPPSISKPPSSLASQAPSPNKKPMIGSRTVGSSAAAAVYDPVALGLKENTVLEWTDMNSSPLERRAEDPKYSQVSEDTDMTDATSSAGAAAGRSTRSRAKAQDFLD